MSRFLDSLLDRQRRAECARNDAVTSAREIRASGNHLAAQNDEPEPCDIPREHCACRDCLDRGCPRCWS